MTNLHEPVIIVLNKIKPESIHYLGKILDILDLRKVDSIILDTYAEDEIKDFFAKYSKILNDARFIISLGGDGTLLFTARKFSHLQKPILAINIGTYGFLMEFSKERVEDAVNGALDGSFTVFRRMMLSAKIIENDEVSIETLALNDVVLSKTDLSRPIRLDVEVENHSTVPYRGDGVIIATPTGSTGYSLAAHGPIIAPDVEAIIVTPISPHSLFYKPIIIPSMQKVSVYPSSPDLPAALTIDGQKSWVLNSSQHVYIERSAQTSLMFKSRRDFYKTVTKRFLL